VTTSEWLLIFSSFLASAVERSKPRPGRGPNERAQESASLELASYSVAHVLRGLDSASPWHRRVLRRSMATGSKVEGTRGGAPC